MIFLTAAASADVNDTVIVRFRDGVKAESFKYMAGGQLEPLVPSMGLYALKLNASTQRSVGVDGVLRLLSRNSEVSYAHKDHAIQPRQGISTEELIDNVAEEPAWHTPLLKGNPDDSDFSQQWDLTLSNNAFGIDALDAWQTFGTGGTDAAGNDIVVAVIDGGVDFNHEDLQDNIWVNEGEIPGNGIDDDQNGYVDDVSGWNAFTNNANVPADRHGTHVAGTIGAQGNNSLGVTGVNVNVKIMGLRGSTGNTSIVLKAYGYVLAQKKLWLDTNGVEGANVVATNSSFGVDRGNCNSSSYQAWNDIYNEMGRHGILSAAATANSSWDIDRVGDVPTGCDSPYILAVTNTDINGRRGRAGYGRRTIDLAAPGTRIYSTLPGDRYGNNTGTSMATPHVAGAVGYLHSVASAALNQAYLQDPASGALEMKRLLLETVSSTSALQRETVSGGILNLYTAAEAAAGSPGLVAQ